MDFSCLKLGSPALRADLPVAPVSPGVGAIIPFRPLRGGLQASLNSWKSTLPGLPMVYGALFPG